MLLRSTAAGPGRPLTACRRACCTPSTASFGVVATVTYLLIDLKMLGRSRAPNSPEVFWNPACCGTPPSETSVIMTMGEPLM